MDVRSLKNLRSWADLEQFEVDKQGGEMPWCKLSKTKRSHIPSLDMLGKGVIPSLGIMEAMWWDQVGSFNNVNIDAFRVDT